MELAVGTQDFFEGMENIMLVNRVYNFAIIEKSEDKIEMISGVAEMQLLLFRKRSYKVWLINGFTWKLSICFNGVIPFIQGNFRTK